MGACKPTIRISYAPNEQWQRGHLIWMNNLTSYLGAHFNIELNIIEFEYKTHDFRSLANIAGVCDAALHIRDTEIIIENCETFETVLFSFTEHAMLEWLTSKYTKQMFCSHYNPKMFSPYITNAEADKLLPFFGLDLGDPHTQSNWRDLRIDYMAENAKFRDLFIRCCGVNDYRQVIKCLNEKYSELGFDALESMNLQDYITKLQKHKVALSYFVDNTHSKSRYNELCYRDFEYAACGIPFIRIEYTSTTWEPLIPNVHYISIPKYIADAAYSSGGNEAVADVIMHKYYEVIDNDELLNSISYNLATWFDAYASPDVSIQLAFENSIIQEWVK